MTRPIPRSSPPRRPEAAGADGADGGDGARDGGDVARDHGAASSLSVVLLTPVFLVLGLAAFQAAIWSHARTEARAVARDTAALVARSGVPAGDARGSAEAVLAADTVLRDVEVEIAVTTRLVTVTVRARAPGVIRGTWSSMTVTAAVPMEGWVP